MSRHVLIFGARRTSGRDTPRSASSFPEEADTPAAGAHAARIVALEHTVQTLAHRIDHHNQMLWELRSAVISNFHVFEERMDAFEVTVQQILSRVTATPGSTFAPTDLDNTAVSGTSEYFGPLLPGWEQHWSQEHQHIYYWHAATRRSSWDRPAMRGFRSLGRALCLVLAYPT